MITRVLFNWKPRALDYRLNSRFRQRLMRAGWYTLPALVQVRAPEFNAIIMDDVKVWHQDEGDRAIRFAVWANVRPTQVRFPDGSLLSAQDGDVILIANDEAEHRAPQDQANRWFVRTGLIINTDEVAR